MMLFFLRLLLWPPAFPGAPSGTKALIPLPGFHLRGRDEVRPCIHRLLGRKAVPAGRSCRGTSGRHDGLPQANAFLSQSVYLKASRDRGTGFDWLLIEARLLAPFDEESAGADGHKDLLVTAVLCGDKPLERLHPSLDHPLVFASPTGQDERLRQPRIGIRKALLKPLPGFGVAALVDIKQTIGERVANALDGPVAGEPVQIGLHAENAECPRARTAERECRRNRCLKQSSRRSPQSCILRLARAPFPRPTARGHGCLPNQRPQTICGRSRENS